MAEASQSFEESSARVICVDDDPIMRSLIQSKINSLVEEFDEAEDGLQAWGKFKQKNYDLAFIDLEMPNLDGFNLIRCIRGNKATQHMPIVVVSSREDSEAIRTALQAGASSYLVKPMNWSLFQPMVSQLLRLASMARELDQLKSRTDYSNLQQSEPTSKIVWALEENLKRISDLAAKARIANDAKLITSCLSEISILAEGAMSSLRHEDQQISNAVRDIASSERATA